MATQRTSFAKLQRDRDKQAKAAAKRDRRQQRNTEPSEGDVVDVRGDGELTASELLVLVERVHQQYEDKEISFEEFEETKTALLARIPVD
jgi:hypothetical protein